MGTVAATPATNPPHHSTRVATDTPVNGVARARRPGPGLQGTIPPRNPLLLGYSDIWCHVTLSARRTLPSHTLWLGSDPFLSFPVLSCPVLSFLVYLAARARNYCGSPPPFPQATSSRPSGIFPPVPTYVAKTWSMSGAANVGLRA